MSLNRYVPVVHLADVAMPAGWTFVVATCGVHADKTGDARERYNRLSRGTQVLLSLWNGAAAVPAESLAAALEAAGGPEPLHDLIAGSAVAGFSRDVLGRRLTHFVREDARVAEATRALGAGDREWFARLAADTQREAGELLGNQIDETRVLADEALTAGAWAASSFGAGFGGSVWALTGSGDAERLGRDWLARYRARRPRAGRTDWFVAPPGPGRVEVTDE